MRFVKLLPFEKDLAKASTLPAVFYREPDVYALERERLFARTWQPVARVFDLERPGDYVTNEIVGEPIGFGQMTARFARSSTCADIEPTHPRRAAAIDGGCSAAITAGRTTCAARSSAPPRSTAPMVKRENGVHHFQGLLHEFLGGEP